MLPLSGRSLVSLAALAALTLAVAPDPLGAQWRRDEVTAERRAAAPVAGAVEASVHAGAGSLRVVGVEGLGEVRARGVARASSKGLLEQVQLTVTRRGDRIVVRAEMPEDRDFDDDEHASLDLVVELPKTLALFVEDGSGEAEVRGVKSLEARDGSGNLVVADVGGPVSVTDGSGELRLDDVRGDVDIEDGSGAIELRGVRGSVTIADGSGSFDARDVTGGVRVRAKGSGSIDVDRVGGDFVVERRSSGSVNYHEVKGRVDVPDRRRRGRDW